MNLDDGSDKVFEFYYTVVEGIQRKIGDDNDSIMQQAMKVYSELTTRKAGEDRI